MIITMPIRRLTEITDDLEPEEIDTKTKTEYSKESAPKAY